MKKKIFILDPTVEPEEYAGDKRTYNFTPYLALHNHALNSVKGPDTEIVHKACPPGIFEKVRYSVVDYFMNALELPRICRSAIEAEKEGADAIIVACAMDPGLRILRTLVDIPVIGELESTLHVACQMGRKIGIIGWPTGGCMTVPAELVRQYGLESYAIPDLVEPALEYTSTTDRELLDAQTNPGEFAHKFLAVAAENLVKRGAEVVIICSTGLSMIAENGGLSKVENIITNAKLVTGSVPVLNVISVSLKMAELMVDLQRGLGIPAASRAGYYQRADAILKPGELDKVRKKFEKDW